MILIKRGCKEKMAGRENSAFPIDKTRKRVIVVIEQTDNKSS